MRKKRRFTNEFKREVVAQFLSGTSTAAQLCRKHQISSAVLYHWKKRYERGKLDNEPTAEGALLERIAELERKLGQVILENDILKKARDFLLERAKRKESSLPAVVDLADLSSKLAKP